MKNKNLKKNGYHIEEEVMIDLVCGMELAPGDTKFKSEYEGKIYYFCSENCQEHFEADPDKYTQG